MPSAQFSATIHASFEHLEGLLRDKVAKPRKYVPVVKHSHILEAGEGWVLREMYQPHPGDLTIRERISEREIPNGLDFVFEFVDSPVYTGSFHNELIRMGDERAGVELTYRMDWQPLPGVEDPMTTETAQAMVKGGVLHLKEMAEEPVVVPDWVRHFFDVVDSMNTDLLGPVIAEDVRFRLGNNTEVRGRENMLTASASTSSLFAAIQHDYVDVEVCRGGDRAYVDSFVEYTKHDGTRFLIPFLTVLEKNAAGEITTVQANGDISPLRHGW